jgi:hypothetical protein
MNQNNRIHNIFTLLSIIFPIALHSCENNIVAIAQSTCSYVLQMTKIAAESSSIPHTLGALDMFFSERKISNYADAAKFGKNNHFLDDAPSFNAKMNTIFKKNGDDVIPKDSKVYQALILNTSGIDVFMERLAFLSRLTKLHAIQTNEIIALVGTHPHREDLRNPDYLVNLPTLFNTDFELASYNKDIVQKNLASLNAQENWIHRDGMEVAWQLVACDTAMEKLKNKFRYFSGESASSFRTEELLKDLIARGLQQPLSQEAPIAFVVTAQAASTMQKMIESNFPQATDMIDLLIARPITGDIEEKLFNDTPQQSAMTKLFAFYCLLKTIK